MRSRTATSSHDGLSVTGDERPVAVAQFGLHFRKLGAHRCGDIARIATLLQIAVEAA